jgi:NADPH-dependent 2,4-dienoyl-CoA reductase/sulfur reductase-like enzyme
MNGERMQKHFDFLLLGGGPASVSAAETLRAEGAKGSILLVSDQVYAPYGHTYLSKQFLFGALPKEKLLIHSEASFENLRSLKLTTAASGELTQCHRHMAGCFIGAYCK